MISDYFDSYDFLDELEDERPRHRYTKLSVKELLLHAEDDVYSQSDLLDMGWTKTMINQLLPRPMFTENPHDPAFAPMKLWWKSKVDEVMQSKGFIVAHNLLEQKQEKVLKTRSKRAAVQRPDTPEEMDKIIVRMVPEKTIVQLALKEQAEKQMDKGDYMGAAKTMASGVATRARLSVEYVFNHLLECPTDPKLISVKRRKETIRVIGLKKIAKAYPHYAEECQRQLTKYTVPEKC